MVNKRNFVEKTIDLIIEKLVEKVIEDKNNEISEEIKRLSLEKNCVITLDDIREKIRKDLKNQFI
ncbi:MAG: hypothetical protein GX287_03550 [Fusobacteria bacterium]|nr:hypothetical protein [Fusobacteriota bacterium]